MSFIEDGKFISNEGQILGHKDTHVTVRLVKDNETQLLLRLDRGLAQAKHKLDAFPDYIVLPDDASHLYLPIPFEIYFMGITMNSYAKPAWMRVKKSFNIGVPKWKKIS